jgi:hypothetical protein
VQLQCRDGLPCEAHAAIVRFAQTYAEEKSRKDVQEALERAREVAKRKGDRIEEQDHPDRWCCALTAGAIEEGIAALKPAPRENRVE